MRLKEEIKVIHEEKYSSIWNTHLEKSKDPEPFEFDYYVTDKTGEEIDVTVSGFWNSDYQEIEELRILDKFKNDITNLFNDKETLRDIEEAINLI